MAKQELRIIEEAIPLIPGTPSTDSAHADLTTRRSIYLKTEQQLYQALDILPVPAAIVDHNDRDPLKYTSPVFRQLDPKHAESISNVLNTIRGVGKIRMHITDGPSLDLHVSSIPGGTNTLAIIHDISEYELEKQELERRHQAEISRQNEALSTTSHDLKNPFIAAQMSASVIKYNAEEMLRQLQKKNPDLEEVSRLIEQTIQTAEIVERSSKRGIAMIIEGIKTRNLSEELRKENISITNVLNVVMNDYSGRIKIAGIEVKLQLPSEDSLLLGDAEALASVAGNLIGNAIDATAGVITISCEEKDGHIEIRISDTGPGISKQNQQEIFKKGFSSGKQNGSGIGLYTAREIAQLHGGDVRLENTTTREDLEKNPSLEQTGSTFVLILPLIKQTS